jgi:hypothetical protein
MKDCPSCKIKKEYTEFNKNKARKDGYETLGLSRTAINSVLSGRSKTSGGYYWCYKEEYDHQKRKNTMYDTNKIKIKQLHNETK